MHDQIACEAPDIMNGATHRYRERGLKAYVYKAKIRHPQSWSIPKRKRHDVPRELTVESILVARDSENL
jgi:hypothetical protein